MSEKQKKRGRELPKSDDGRKKLNEIGRTKDSVSKKKRGDGMKRSGDGNKKRKSE